MVVRYGDEVRGTRLQAVEPTSRVIFASIADDHDFQVRGDSAAEGGGFSHHPGDVALVARARNHDEKTGFGGLTANAETLARQIVRGYVRDWIG